MFRKIVKAYWCNSVDTYGRDNSFQNFGDMLNPFIFSYFDIILDCEEKDPTLYAIGSILNNISEDFKGYIWTSGCLFNKKVNFSISPIAVRGKLTLNCLENIDKTNIVLGDGGLILDRLYKPMILKKKYKLGVMPHYVDIVYSEKYIPIYKFPIFENDDVIFIDPRKDVKVIINTLCSCENVIVSCLHGLVICDSYGIKHASFQGEFSGPIMFKGAQQSFKFKDYYSVFDIDFIEPDMHFNIDSNIEECISKCKAVNKPELENIKDNLMESLNTLVKKLKS